MRIITDTHTVDAERLEELRYCGFDGHMYNLNSQKNGLDYWKNRKFFVSNRDVRNNGGIRKVLIAKAEYFDLGKMVSFTRHAL